MAKAKTAKKRTASRPAAAARRPAKKQNTGGRHRAAHRPAARRPVARRHNAGGNSPGGLVTNALWLIGGAVSTKLLTQSVLGAKNTGVMGYVGNALAAFGLSLLAAKLLHNQAAAKSILAGGVVQIVLRAIGDYTPFGEFAKSFGMGDYLASNFVTPQRYADALNSAEVEIPNGWAPRVVQSNAPPAQIAAGVAGYGNSMYSARGLYSA